MAKPLKELRAGCREAHGVKTKVAEAKGLELGGGAASAVSRAASKAVPEEGGCVA